MREHVTTLFECEVCGHKSTDRDKIVRCEARGREPSPEVGKVGWVRRRESDRDRWGELCASFDFLVQVRVVSCRHEGHVAWCKVEVVEWPDADRDEWHQDVFSVLDPSDKPEEVLADEIEFDREAAEKSVLS